MTMTPAVIDRCQATSIAADVRWMSVGRGGVRLWAYGLGQSPKLWMVGPRHGHIRTDDNWLVEGSTIMLTDKKGHVLARRTITARDCPSTSPSKT